MSAPAPAGLTTPAEAGERNRSARAGRVEPITLGLEANRLADLDQVQARGIHLDKVRLALGLQLDLDPPRRSKPVHAPHHAAEGGALGRNRHVVGADEQACASIRQALWVEV